MCTEIDSTENDASIVTQENIPRPSRTPPRNIPRVSYTPAGISGTTPGHLQRYEDALSLDPDELCEASAKMLIPRLNTYSARRVQHKNLSA